MQRRLRNTNYTMKALHLTLIKKWFDLIEIGEKPEEYREMTDYWKKRLVKKECQHKTTFKPSDFRDFDLVIFTNGYGNHRPRTLRALKYIEVNTGKVEWGASPGKIYFVLKLGAKI